MNVQAHDNTTRSAPGLGHNAIGHVFTVEVRLFNKVYRQYGDGKIRHAISCSSGATVGELLAQLKVPASEVFLAFVNGRDISHKPGDLQLDFELQEDDVLALSGPVPYSWGYGAPVV